MIRTLYSVKDVKAEMFSPPMVSINENTMLRSLVDAVLDSGHQYSRHPEDFVLYRLGEFDDLTGQVVLEEAPISVKVLADLVPPNASAVASGLFVEGGSNGS